jgi:hypothetical protein
MRKSRQYHPEVVRMPFFRPGLFLILVAFLLTPVCPAQSVANDDIFTVAVAAPTSAKDVQLRYFFIGGAGGSETSVAESLDDNKVRIKTSAAQGAAKSIRLIAYAPGCQLVLVTADDLSITRQANFECQKLSTVPLRGRLDTLNFGQQELQIEALYDCRWAMSFFGLADGAVSPLSLGKTKVASDGTFTVEVPDFVNDPSWANASRDAGLMFALSDAKTGRHLAMLTPLSQHSHDGDPVPVASSYPELFFAVH